jgi:hypothetical protein
MSYQKFVIYIIGIVLAIVAFAGSSFAQAPIKEGWMGMGQLGRKAMPYIKNQNGSKSAFSGNFLNTQQIDRQADMRGSGQFVSVPTYQSMLSPRFFSGQYGANIQYNMPDRKNTAVPCSPLTYGDMASDSSEGFNTGRGGNRGGNSQEGFTNGRGRQQENYTNGQAERYGMDSPPSCGKGAYGLGRSVNNDNAVPPDYHSGNWQEVRDTIGSPEIENALPLGAMNTVDSMGNEEQVVVYNNLMYAPRPISRLNAQGDPIRGDVPQVPVQSGWFSVYPNLSTDLKQGALQVMGGDNSTNLQTLALIKQSGAQTMALGGIDFSQQPPPNMAKVSMALQSIGDLSANASDVSYSSFP